MIDFGSADAVALTPLPTFENGRGVFRLAAPIVVTLRIPGRTIDFLTIPAGFVSDGCSVPWWSRRWLDAWGDLGLPAILHDYLFRETAWPKWLADALFLIALRAQGVPALRATILYFAVRARRR